MQKEGVEVNKIIVVTARGMVLKFDSADIRETHRGGKGVRGINVDEEDYVVSAFTVED